MLLATFSSFLVVLLTVKPVFCAFGADISPDNADTRFSVMGKVTKDEFNVTNGVVDLKLNVQDTENVYEFWILDFQEFKFIQNAYPIDETTGNLVSGRTGECSSVYEDSTFPTYFEDGYFTDKVDGELASKKLFTEFVRGTVDANNKRTDQIIFEGDMGTFFSCLKSDGITNIWQVAGSNSDEIEYRTKLYATNVRPKDDAVATAGISFVQSHIELIWRLSRTAIGKFIISSTAILKPIFEFAIVSTVYDAAGDPIPTQARLKLRFTTIVDSDAKMVVYKANEVDYIPDNADHNLITIEKSPATTITTVPTCIMVTDIIGTDQQYQCHQTWEFQFLLSISTDNIDNNVPIDASGVFEFLFDTYTCTNVGGVIDVSTCILDDGEPAKLSAAITIQTTVLLEDAEDDKVTITLVSLRGANNDEFSADGARGVLHKEEVTLDVKFSPALLRADYTLKLMLFMVCRGSEYSTPSYPDGCLAAPSLDRYVAHVDDEFSFGRPAIGAPSFDGLDVVSDFTQALSSHAYVQLDGDGNLMPVPLHRSVFVNLALSAVSCHLYNNCSLQIRRENYKTERRLSATTLIQY
uniref:Uncharacterized protein LOC102804246 n=1 Tax=Saccoglossus kowalevskii TaxID=10224 RepID=A0ABM0M6C2_SACKO|nr:PREDICTED: uncharacterized protein LOC102804246 [Saccoglossus kowalevskii]